MSGNEDVNMYAESLPIDKVIKSVGKMFCAGAGKALNSSDVVLGVRRKLSSKTKSSMVQAKLPACQDRKSHECLKSPAPST